MSLLSPAAYWAAWADILPIIAERVPALADRVLPELERRDSAIACAAQAAAAEEAVAGPAFPQQPSWRELADGARPPQRETAYYTPTRPLLSHGLMVLPAIQKNKSRFGCIV